jgi:RNase P protein component
VLREAWRSLRARAREGYDIVLVARPEIRGMRAREMAEQIEQALAAEGALRG